MNADPFSKLSDEPVVVIGMGAIGATIAAKIAQSGRPVIAACCSRVERLVVTDDHGTIDVAVTWVSNPDDIPVSRWILLATKMHHIPTAAPWLWAATDERSRVIVLQNGVEHRERVGPYTRGTVVPALVYPNAERLSPGVVRTRLTPLDLVLPNDEASHEVNRELFAPTPLRVEIAEDFLTASWIKLLTNLAANPITALTGRRVEVLKESLVSILAKRVLDEAVEVGRASGANLGETQASETLAWLQRLQPGSTSSMLQDRNAGRSLEYDGLTGVVVRRGEQYGIPTPTNSGLLALLSALEPSLK